MKTSFYKIPVGRIEKMINAASFNDDPAISDFLDEWLSDREDMRIEEIDDTPELPGLCDEAIEKAERIEKKIVCLADARILFDNKD
jgi:hypothetical protein